MSRSNFLFLTPFVRTGDDVNFRVLRRLLSPAAMHTLISPATVNTVLARTSDVIDLLGQFVDGNGLLACEGVSYRWRLATDRTSLWKVRRAQKRSQS